MIPSNPQSRNNGLTKWLRTARAYMVGNQLTQSADSIISKSPYGVKLSQKKMISTWVRWCGDFAADRAYNIGDVVNVTEDKEITIVGNKFYQRKGVYLCVFPVPIVITIEGQFTPGTDQYIIDYINSQNKRSVSVTYAPIYPEPLIMPLSVTVNQQAKFWQMIGLHTIDVNMCVNGTTKTFQIQGCPKDSLTA
jgi:hypothetical protein